MIQGVSAAPPAIVTTMPTLPDGWHTVRYAVLADGSLAIVSADRDLTAEWRGDENGAWLGDPLGVASTAMAKVWMFDGETLIGGPAFPLLTRSRSSTSSRTAAGWLRALALGRKRTLAC